MALIPDDVGSRRQHSIRVPVPDLKLQLPPNQDQSRVLRAKIREWGSAEGYPAPYVDDVVLVASELFSNAVRATVGGATIMAGVERRTDGATVRMTNEGPGFDPDALSAPHSDDTGGRGIWLAKALGTLGVTQRKTKTIVTVIVG